MPTRKVSSQSRPVRAARADNNPSRKKPAAANRKGKASAKGARMSGDNSAKSKGNRPVSGSGQGRSKKSATRTRSGVRSSDTAGAR